MPTNKIAYANLRAGDGSAKHLYQRHCHAAGKGGGRLLVESCLGWEHKLNEALQITYTFFPT